MFCNCKYTTSAVVNQLPRSIYSVHDLLTQCTVLLDNLLVGLPTMTSKALWSLLRTQKIKTVLTPTPLKKILLEKKEHQKKENVHGNISLSVFIDIFSLPKLHSEGENSIQHYVFNCTPNWVTISSIWNLSIKITRKDSNQNNVQSSFCMEKKT